MTKIHAQLRNAMKQNPESIFDVIVVTKAGVELEKLGFKCFQVLMRDIYMVKLRVADILKAEQDEQIISLEYNDQVSAIGHARDVD